MTISGCDLDTKVDTSTDINRALAYFEGNSNTLCESLTLRHLFQNSISRLGARRKAARDVHVLNDNVVLVPVQHDLAVQVRLPEIGAAVRCTMRTPDDDDETELPVHVQGGCASVTVPGVRVYAALTIQY